MTRCCAVVSDPEALQDSRDEALGARLSARCGFAAGEPLLVEAPALVWGAEDADPDDVLRFAQACPELVEAPCGCEAWHAELRRTSVLAAALKARPLLAAWRRAEQCVRDDVLSAGLQTCCAEDSSPMALAVRRAAAAVATDSESEVFAQVLGCAVANAYDFQPEDSEALFLFGSIIEHSCDPNVCFAAWQSPEGSIFGVFRALRPIATGEAIRNSYLEDELLRCNVQRRRTALYERQGFVCACIRCTAEGGLASSWLRPGRKASEEGLAVMLDALD
ncbi:unnamed protein product [Polarella glacialis]|uniref:SET domain-containing protein n=1 Tax=Polarella glacialis TaxID=89957 RepID=A0A813HWG5_POLGL|nr:unnamed protein product [Polarella glacialis]CAE8642086.1 unnamed protein product [Polarella glacialis]